MAILNGMNEGINMPDNKMIESKQQFNQFIEENETCILYFTSPDCGLCDAILPKLHERIAPYAMEVGLVECLELKEIAGQLLVFAAPTILIMHQGKEILRESRFIDFDKIERILSFIALPDRNPPIV